MRTSHLSILFTLAVALVAVACSTGGSDEAPETGPAAAPNAVLTKDAVLTEHTVLTEYTVLTESPPAPEAPAMTAPLRFTALRENRAYDGAPPVIAHPIGLGTECVECHMDGSEGFEDPDLPPPTPHPELLNCRMCHVYVNAPDTFRENGFEPVGYLTRQQSHDLAPPLIPHPLTMRERCVVCHNHGESASARWSTDLVPLHSEGWNCRMCHVPAAVDAPAPRPGATPLPLGED